MTEATPHCGAMVIVALPVTSSLAQYVFACTVTVDIPTPSLSWKSALQTLSGGGVQVVPMGVISSPSREVDT